MYKAYEVVRHLFMIFPDETSVIEFIKANSNTPQWVNDARDNSKVLRALVLGEDFLKVLINRIEKIESIDRATSRKKYSKDVRDLFTRVMQPRISVFTAHGGSIHNNISSKSTSDKVVDALTNFKGQKSNKKYLSEEFFKLSDTDPNGLMMLEYKDDEDIFPTYKSIDDIRRYLSNGQLCEYVLFEPVNRILDNQTWKEWRLVDDKTDWRVKQKGTEFSIIEKPSTFEHPFSNVPAVILSDIQKTGSELRVSSLFPIEELSKDFARDKSIKTIYKFQHGFPRHWRYDPKCRPCTGTGKTGNEDCSHCGGTGSLRVNDVTDVTTLDFPREDDPIVTPNLEGFSTPDLETWLRMTEELKDIEESMDSTMWGDRRINRSTSQEKTATETFVNIQQVHNRLGGFTDNVEWVNSQLIKWVEDWANGSPKVDQEYIETYGRMYIVTSPEVILQEYDAAREAGANNTVLDKLLDEYLLSKYQTDPQTLELMQKKRELEPYIHNSTSDVNEWFGAKEAEKKVLFPKFWNQAETNKDLTVLEAEMKEYFNTNSNITNVTNEPPEQ